MKFTSKQRKTTSDTMAEMLGYPPNETLRRKIIEEMRETGQDLRQVASNYALPVVENLNAEGRFFSEEYGKLMTPDEYRKTHPLGEYLKFYEMPK